MNWYPNGIIFQELCRPTKFSCDFSYEGLNAYYQNPLSGINDTACKELSRFVSYRSNEDGTCTPLEFISNLGLAAKYITLCRKEKMMHVRKDNWDVQEIDFEQFTALKENTFTIGSAFNHPKHCHNLNINIRCLMVESFFDNPHFDFIINPEKTAFLGYEFVATDMQSSSSYEDLCDELFSPLLGLLNNNWIFDSPQDVQQYVDFRESLERQGYEFERYYYPRIVRLSEIHLPI